MRKDFVARYGPWAVIAGASEGIGEQFAAHLAARGLNLVLIARREEPLRALADRLARDAKIEARVVVLDLGAPDLPARIAAATEGLEVGLLVYNAAASRIGEFTSVPLDVHLRTVDVNCRGPVTLAHALAPAMVARARGGMVFMSSMAASQGTPLVSSYGGTKAFNLVFAESLWEELGPRGVDVIACRAGATRTPGYESSRPGGGIPVMEPAAVVSQVLAALGRGPSMVPGWFNRVTTFIMGRLLPRRMAVRVMGGATRKLYSLPAAR